MKNFVKLIRNFLFPPKWHLVSVTFDRYDPKSLSLFDSASSLKLFYDGKMIQEANIKYPEDYSFSVWFNHKTKLPFLGIDPV